MELEDLSSKLHAFLDEADMASDGGDTEMAREWLRKAKQLLDEELET